jgi:hypothetical protein
MNDFFSIGDHETAPNRRMQAVTLSHAKASGKISNRRSDPKLVRMA